MEIISLSLLRKTIPAGIPAFLFCAFLLLYFFPLHGQVVVKEEPLNRILFVLDASNSMNGRWKSGTKREIAFKKLSEVVDSLSNRQNVELALRVYGHQKGFYPNPDCSDTKLEVPFSKNSSKAIKDKLSTINPKGTTPIALSLEKAAGDFPPCANCRNIIILITDGIEECGGDPCAISLALQRKGVVLKPFVIGIGLDLQLIDAFKCTGNYYDASKEESFKKVLETVISQATNATTAQVNLLDITGKPSETDVNMTFYNYFTGKIHYNYLHTINHKGNPDTILIDPAYTYSITVHTIPPVSKDSIVLNTGVHNIIALDAPQGYLHLTSVEGSDYKNIRAIIRKSGEMKTLNVQALEQKEKYIVGKYDIEVLSLPRIYIKNVQIKQSHTAKIEIPQPGIASFISFSEGYGSLFLEEAKELKWIYNFDPSTTRETLTLQPGNYRVVYRAKSAKESIFTIEKSFKIVSGGSVSVKLY